MKITKEIKVGALGILAILIFYFGFTFLKGLDIFSTNHEYHVVYDDVQGLETSNPVTYNGVNVGRVLFLTPNFEKGNIDVTLEIKRNVAINVQTEAILSDNGIIGGKVIKLKMNSGKFLAENGFLKSGKETSLMKSVEAKLSPSLRNIDSLTLNLTKIVKQFDKVGETLKTLLTNAAVTSTGVNALVAGNSLKIGQVTTNAAALTENLNTLTKSLDGQIKPILSKTNVLTDSLSKIQLGKTVNQLNGTIANVQKMLADINSGKGTLGKLKADDSLYINLDRSAASVNQLLIDMKANPKKYVHFSLFGRKN